MTGLTDQQCRCLRFIRERTAETGVCPSYSEIGKAIGVRSTSGVHVLLARLEQRGHIIRKPGLARAIDVVSGVAGPLTESELEWCQANAERIRDLIHAEFPVTSA